MNLALTHCSALYADGLTELSGDIPGRSVFFGAVTDPLPEIIEPEYAFRTCRLIAAAVQKDRAAWNAFVARHGADRVAVVLGTSDTGVDEAETAVDAWLDAAAGNPDAPKPEEMRFSMLELGTPAEYLAKTLGVKGPAYAISTACSSSAKVFPAARRLIEAGFCDAAVVGGADARCRFALNGFHALGALSAGRCRPLAEDRDGICLGEGVALFALERGEGPVLLAGTGESSDAYHPTAPDPEGRGAEVAMRAALADAGIAPEDVDYVNLHGTGTPANDAMEMKAVRRVFGDRLPCVESTKDRTGHCLGAAGAVEAAICRERILAGACRVALSNSFAFGGSNASVVFRLP